MNQPQQLNSSISSQVFNDDADDADDFFRPDPCMTINEVIFVLGKDLKRFEKVVIDGTR